MQLHVQRHCHSLRHGLGNGHSIIRYHAHGDVGPFTYIQQHLCICCA